MENMENFDYEKVVKCSKKYRKLTNSLNDIFSKKSNVVYVFGRNENEILEKLSKYGLNKNNLISVGYGGYIHKDNLENYKNLNKYIKNTKKEFTKDKYNACGLYLNYLYDYECFYSGDFSDAISSLFYYLNINKTNQMDKELFKMLKLTEKYGQKEWNEIN